MLKQRRDAIEQYQKANRQDLADKEAFEVTVIESYMPQPLRDDELQQLIDTVVRDSGATSMKEMGKVMAQLKDRVQGRADMGAVSAKVRERLSGAG